MYHVAFNDVVAYMIEEAMGKGIQTAHMSETLEKYLPQDSMFIYAARILEASDHRDPDMPVLENQGDVLCFPLDLQFGILKNPLGMERIVAIEMFWRNNRSEQYNTRKAFEAVHTAKENLQKVKKALKNGEKVIIWYGMNPEEYCGYMWLLYELRNTPTDTLFTMVCPEHFTDVDGQKVLACSWVFEDSDLFVTYEENLSHPTDQDKKRLNTEWQSLVQEKSPIRIVQDGEVIGMPASAYDEEVKAAIRRVGKLSFDENEVVHEVLRMDASVNSNMVMVTIDRLADLKYIKQDHEVPFERGRRRFTLVQ